MFKPLWGLCLGLAGCPRPGDKDETSDETAETGAPCPSTAVYYADADADGYGTGLDAVDACEAPEGYLPDAGDCDDGDSAIHPGAPETCDGADQDCDGAIDEGETEDGAEYHVDSDGDAYGDPTQVVRACSPAEGLVVDGSDCDDADPTTFPGAPEQCGDGVANDCDAVQPGCDWAATRTLDAASAALIGVDPEDHAGGSVAGLGDTDGDGVPDLAVGAAGTGDMGLVYLQRGPLRGENSLGDATAIIAGESGDQIGASVAAAGDLNGDGYADLLLGAPGDGGSGAVFYGPVSGAFTPSEADLRAQPDGGTLAGAAVAGGADADGDGTPDLLLGDPADAGGAWLVSGAAPEEAIWLSGETADGAAGLAVAFTGDMDGDGLSDLAVGAPYAGEVLGGAAYLVLAPVTGPLALADAAWVLEGAAEDHLGRSVAGLDADGDGYADLLVGATGSDAAGENAGAAYYFRGPPVGRRYLADPDALVLGEAAGDGAGYTVASTGDLDGDGGLTWAMGATGEDSGGAFAGAVYLLRGAPAGTVSLTDADAKLTGVAAGDSAGVGLAGAGDADGDGRDDVLIGAWGVDTGGTWAGAALIVPGAGY